MPPAFVDERTTQPAAPEMSSGRLRSGAVRLLKAIAQRHPTPLTRVQAATLAAFSVKGGTFGTYLGDLKRNAFIAEHGGRISVTPAGMDYLGDGVPEQPQTTADLLAMWRGALRAGAYRMLELLVEAYPDGYSRADLGEMAGFAVSGGTFGTYLGDLKRNGLVEEADGALFASETLFLDGVRS